MADLPLVLPWQHPDGHSAFHLYVVRLKLNEIRATHLEIFTEIRAAGILINVHYIPVHTQPYYQNLGFQQGDFPIAEQYYHEAISLPIYPKLLDTQQDHVVDVLSRAVRP